MVRPAQAAPTHVLLLRGVNVGGRNRLPMEALRALLAEAGCAGVRTYIQSGNAVLSAAPALARRLPAALTALLRARLGLTVPVVLRTVAELEAAARRNPFLAAGADPATLHLAFLAGAPTRAAAAALDPARSPPDAFRLLGRELYLSLPGGVGKTRLTSDYLDRTLGTTCTLRNWRTVLELVALARG